MPTLSKLVDPLGVRPLVSRTARGTASTAAGVLGGAAAGALDRVLAADWTSEAVDRIVASELADRAVRTLIASPLVETAVRGAVERGVVERVVADLLDAGAVERIAERVAAGPELDRLLTGALESERTAQLVGRVLESEGVDRLVAQVLDSRLVDATVARVLVSDELWLVVDEVAQSPAVTEAIAHQGAGFADQVAGEVGKRSRKADDRLERAARRLLHRPPRHSDDAAPVIGDGTR